MVLRDVPPYALMVGVPARRIGWACRCGIILPKPAPDGLFACTACGNQYQEQNGSLKPLKEVQENG